MKHFFNLGVHFKNGDIVLCIKNFSTFIRNTHISQKPTKNNLDKIQKLLCYNIKLEANTILN